MAGEADVDANVEVNVNADDLLTLDSIILLIILTYYLPKLPQFSLLFFLWLYSVFENIKESKSLKTECVVCDDDDDDGMGYGRQD